jgi:myo-inositol 2-dehydrogenase/D-chiro-inositol 1-dehydrogenase
MGRRHARALARSRATRLVAVCDPVRAAAEAAAAPGVAVHEHVDDVLADRSIAGVLIAAPTPLHDTLVERALVAGKHVLCEKPLTLDVRRDVALGRLAEDLGLVLQVGFWRRFAWPYREAARLLDEGAIGEPRLVRAAQWDAEPPPPAFCDPAVSGGIEVDCGVHELDIAAWLLGSPIARVSASGTPGDPAIEAVGDVEALAGLAVTASGVPVTIDLARSVRYGDDVRTEIVGARGAILISAVGAGSLAVGDATGLVSMPLASDDVLDDALAAQADAFAGAVGGTHDPALPGAIESAHALAAAQALRRARRSRAIEIV